VTDRQAEDGQTIRRQGAAYQGAFEAVFAILIAAGIGYWADERFGTSPRWLLVGVAVGFASFVLRLVKLGRTLQQPPPEDGGPDEPDDGH
jgi:F0F1-type ATP synthase assembly protein I